MLLDATAFLYISTSFGDNGRVRRKKSEVITKYRDGEKCWAQG